MSPDDADTPPGPERQHQEEPLMRTLESAPPAAPASTTTPPAGELSVAVAGWRVAARRGRVWLHPLGDGDGDLHAGPAFDLAAAVADAARVADRQAQAAGE
jgi:hypothetical protein